MDSPGPAQRRAYSSMYDVLEWKSPATILTLYVILNACNVRAKMHFFTMCWWELCERAGVRLFLSCPCDD